MIFQKYIVVMPSLCVDGVYLSDSNGVVSPDYYDSEQDAWSEIKDFKQSFGGGEGHFPVLVTIDVATESMIDEYGFDWSVNLRLQFDDIVISF